MEGCAVGGYLIHGLAVKGYLYTVCIYTYIYPFVAQVWGEIALVNASAAGGGGAFHVRLRAPPGTPCPLGR